MATSAVRRNEEMVGSDCPDYVIMEYVVESMLRDDETTLILLQTLSRSLDDLIRRASARTVKSCEELANDEICILQSATISLKNISGNNLFRALKRAEGEGYRFGIVSILNTAIEKVYTLQLKWNEDENKRSFIDAIRDTIELFTQIEAKLNNLGRRADDAILTNTANLSTMDPQNRSINTSILRNSTVPRHSLSVELDSLRELKKESRKNSTRNKSLKRVLMLFDKGLLAFQNVAFQQWLRVFKSDSVQRGRVLAKLTRAFRKNHCISSAKALFKWVNHTKLLAQADSTRQLNVSLKTDVLTLKSKLLDISKGAEGDITAALLAEKAMNRDLNLVNKELKKVISELEVQFLHKFRADDSDAVNGANGGYGAVPDVLLGNNYGGRTQVAFSGTRRTGSKASGPSALSAASSGVTLKSLFLWRESALADARKETQRVMKELDELLGSIRSIDQQNRSPHSLSLENEDETFSSVGGGGGDRVSPEGRQISPPYRATSIRKSGVGENHSVGDGGPSVKARPGGVRGAVGVTDPGMLATAEDARIFIVHEVRRLQSSLQREKKRVTRLTEQASAYAATAAELSQTNQGLISNLQIKNSRLSVLREVLLDRFRGEAGLLQLMIQLEQLEVGASAILQSDFVE